MNHLEQPVRRSRHHRLVLALVVAVSAAAGSSSAASGDAPSRDRLVTVTPRVQLFVHEEGEGTPLIVVHGGPGLDLNGLAPDLQPLAKQHRVIYYDQRGSGRSSLMSDVTADTMVADLEALRSRLGLARVALLGHSWGGGLVALYAAAHPTRVSRIVLVGPMPLRAGYLEAMDRNLEAKLSPGEQAALRSALRARLTAATEAEDIGSCLEYWAILRKAYYGDPALASRGRGEICGPPGRALASGLRVNGSVFRSLGAYDWTEKMARLRIPMLILHGELDPLPVESAREWARTVPTARLLTFRRSGHMPYIEQPDEFFPAVLGFLAGTWPAGARR